MGSEMCIRDSIFATHDEKIMAYLRRIIHLDDGEITEDEIIENPKAHD